jgi:PadR family transcriptional regulator
MSPSQPSAGRGPLAAGTLEMLILRSLSAGSMHGYAIAQHIQRLSRDVLSVEQGSLYPALERLQTKGWVTSKWGPSPTGRQARYYTITASGRRNLRERAAEYERVARGVARVMRTT